MEQIEDQEGAERKKSSLFTITIIWFFIFIISESVRIILLPDSEPYVMKKEFGNMLLGNIFLIPIIPLFLLIYDKFAKINLGYFGWMACTAAGLFGETIVDLVFMIYILD